MGRDLYGGHSRCFQEFLPGQVSFAFLISARHLCIRVIQFKLTFLLFPQTCPLDLYTDRFYENRKEAIDTRVKLLSESSVETLHDMLEDVWTSQEGKVCSLVSWERFSSLQQAKVLTVTLINKHFINYTCKMLCHSTALQCSIPLQR